MDSEERFRVIDPFNDDISFTFKSRAEAEDFVRTEYPDNRRAMGDILTLKAVPGEKLFAKHNLSDVLEELRDRGLYIETYDPKNPEASFTNEDVLEFAQFFASRFRFFRVK